MPGIFTISLDFELLWGIFDKVGTNYKPEYFSNTRKVIPQMLDCFGKNEIGVTWATVGMLFAENEEEWKAYSPEFTPSYRDKKLSAYEWAKKNGIRPEVHFAPELIRQILDTPFQELGSHSFAHYYTLVRGQSPEQFRQDLKATQKIAQNKFGISLQSLVFPRNHINELYLPICLEEGYEFVRGNPKNWYWQETQHESFGKKFFRSADCFFPVGDKTSYRLDELSHFKQEPLIIPASRILRPMNIRNGLFNEIRLQRILNEMESAAKAGEVYHLWWHPHNFGNDPEASIKELDRVLEKYRELHEKFGLESKSMKMLGEGLLEKSRTKV
ncbi:MAG: polysaccharide deacetylase family protein [Algoriphagus sp.]|uniref:polysaccharide deacetylase family protein n=1 Tax=Algoriphagus sp. TaxID=1872435 RepID=UPI0017ED91E5|nr:polysaccharide deacetylase family protein [Algoriphagus sp.]NVJ86823.1 polysaccharide deacetylase family protein [Algoriphagus sp.]